MSIKHVAILNADSSNHSSNNGVKYAHELRFCLSFKPDRTWMKRFLNIYRGLQSSRKRYIRIEGNELELALYNGDNIQEYIDLVDLSVRRANDYITVKNSSGFKKSCSYANAV